MLPQETDLIWLVVVGFIVAFVLAFGLGANDVANSFGTSVGSKVLTLRQACILATIFELSGSILLGARVSDTIRKGIIDPSLFNGTEKELLAGNVAALAGSCIWLLVATFFNLPVSGTHSIVGSTIGFALVAHGAKGVRWATFGKIIGSWFISPLLSGFLSVSLFLFVRRTILSKKDPLEPGLRWSPLFYSAVGMINAASIFVSGPPLLYFDRIPWWGIIIAVCGIGLIVGLAVGLIVVPWKRRQIIAHCSTVPSLALMLNDDQGSFQSDKDKTPDKLDPEAPPDVGSEKPGIAAFSIGDAQFGADDQKNAIGNDASTAISQTLRRTGDVTFPDEQVPLVKILGDGSESTMVENVVYVECPEDSRTRSSRLCDRACNIRNDTELGQVDGEDRPETGRLFSFLQILTAVFGSFAHGGNDVSNAIGPLVGIWVIWNSGHSEQKVDVPIWILVFGGAGISVGLWVWGRRVIETIGENLTKITPSSGFVIETASAFTVLLASNLSIPISTTHCKVGAVVITGWVRSKAAVDWSLFRNIIIAWIVTVPFTGAISAGLFALLQLVL